MTVCPGQGVYCDNYVCTGCLFPASVSTGNNQDTAGPARVLYVMSTMFN